MSRAAGVIHLSQPAITQAIAKLESQVGQSLFDRTPNGMYPTEAGDLFAGRATRALGFIRSGMAEAARGRKLPDGAVTATQLRALIALAEHGNFNRAARALGLAQPSVHRAARDAETVIGVPLWSRDDALSGLTRAGLALTQAARLMFAELDQARQDLAERQGKAGTRLVLGGLPLARATILPTALARLTRDQPGLSLQVIEGPYDDLLSALTSGAIDVMAGALRDPVPSDQVAQEVLFEDRLGVFAGPRHPLAQEADVDRLAPCPWVVPRRGTPTRQHFDTFIGDRQTGPLIEASSMLLVRNLLQDNTHLTMLSVNQARLDAEAGLMRRLPVLLDDPPRAIGLTVRRSWQPTDGQRLALDVLRQAGRALR